MHKLSFNQMNRKTKRADHPINDPFWRIVICSIIVFSISGVILTFHDQIDNCRRLIPSLLISNITLNGSSPQCSILYEACLCSVLSNNSENSRNCITDIHAMGAHTLPPISLVLQLYVIYELSVSTVHYGYVVLGYFWLATLFFCNITAISRHPISCLYSAISQIICFSGIFMFALASYLVILDDIRIHEDEFSETCRKRRSAKKKYNREIFNEVTVV